jgi:hypothetical protein
MELAQPAPFSFIGPSVGKNRIGILNVLDKKAEPD